MCPRFSIFFKAPGIVRFEDHYSKEVLYFLDDFLRMGSCLERRFINRIKISWNPKTCPRFKKKIQILEKLKFSW